MSSFSTPQLFVLILCIYAQFLSTLAYSVDRELTSDQIELTPKSVEDFPYILPLVLKGPSHVLKFYFVKRYTYYAIPMYMKSKKFENKYVAIETPPTQNTALYEDKNYNATVTLYCEDNDPLFSNPDICNEKLMSGVFYVDGMKYLIEPKRRIKKRFLVQMNESPHEEFVTRHQIFKLIEPNKICSGVNDRKSIKQILPQTAIRHSLDRLSPHYLNIIEVIAVIPHKMPISEDDLRKIKLYYLQLFWDVRRVFQKVIVNNMTFSVLLIGMILEPLESPLFEFFRGDDNSLRLNLYQTQRNLMDLKSRYKCDHMTLFSPYELDTDSKTNGFTDVGSICKENSVSIIKTLGNFQELLIIVHELGHSLGSQHDSIMDKCCDEKDGYIMAPRRNRNTANSFRFSDCSLKFITHHLRNLEPNCLVPNLWEPVKNAVPTGQLYTVKEQCEAISDSSNVCPLRSVQNISTFCLSIWCDRGNFTCESFVPSHKTTCGNKKWCVLGECVHDKNAPVADENCLYGDDVYLDFSITLRNGTSYQPRRCTELLRVDPHFCNDIYLRRRCCQTCFRKFYFEKNKNKPKRAAAVRNPTTAKPRRQSSGGQKALGSSLFLFMTIVICLVNLDSFRK